MYLEKKYILLIILGAVILLSLGLWLFVRFQFSPPVLEPNLNQVEQISPEEELLRPGAVGEETATGTTSNQEEPLVEISTPLIIFSLVR